MILPKAGDWMSISYKMMWLLVHDLDYGFGKIPPVGGMAIRSTIRYPHIAGGVYTSYWEVFPYKPP